MSRNACLLASSPSRSLAFRLSPAATALSSLAWVSAAPLLVLDGADRLLHLAHPGLEVLHAVARDLAGRVPAVGQVAEGLLGRIEVGDGQEGLRLHEDLVLHLRVGRELLVERG